MENSYIIEDEATKDNFSYQIWI